MKEKKKINIINLIFIGAIILSFMYSLGFYTNFLQIRGAYKDIYDTLQIYNRKIFNATGLLMIIGMGSMLLFDAHLKGPKLVFSKISVLVSAAASLYISYMGITPLESLRQLYLTLDVEDVRLFYPEYKMSTSAFYFGYVIFAILTVSALANIVGALIKKKVSEDG